METPEIFPTTEADRIRIDAYRAGYRDGFRLAVDTPRRLDTRDDPDPYRAEKLPQERCALCAVVAFAAALLLAAAVALLPGGLRP